MDPSDKAAVSEAVGSQNLLSIFSVYEKLKGKGAPTETTPQKAPEPSAINPEAEKLKSAGNAAMQQKDYKTAIEKYTEAIKFSPTNPIYLSNRAAAYSASGDHAAAVKDAELAVAADPKYTKAWSRLGLARFAMGDARGSVEAYQQGIDFEGNGGSDAMKKGLETAKKELTRMEAEEENLPEDEVDDAPGNTRGGGGPDLAGLASMLGGGGGGGGGGGFDFASLMNNPMFSSMAQNLMRNPEALSGLMNNPTVQNMMNNRGAGGGGGGGGGGGMPDMSQIQQMMQDPALAGL